MNAGHRSRLRDKYLKSGLQALHDYEMIELLLTFVIPRRDVKPIAKNLLTTFGDIQGIMDAKLADLTACKGVGENAAVMFALLKDLGTEYLKVKVKKIDVLSSPEQVINFVKSAIGGAKQEVFMAIYLNTQNHIIEFEQYEGSIDRINVYPRDVIKRSLELDATSMLLVHNHPSGVTQPSSADISLTRAIDQAAKTVGIILHDHLIVSQSGYYSFRQNKLLK